jgi:hypothetical protein
MNKPIELPKVEMNAEALDVGVFYLWVANKEAKVVWLSPDGLGICTYEVFGCDTYFFENNLIGQLYGPLTIQGAEFQA